MSANKYINMTSEEKESLEQYITEEYGDTSRISAGAAIAQLARQRLEEGESAQ